MIDHIDRKRQDLGLPPPMYEVPYKPKSAEGNGQGPPHGRPMATSLPGPCREPLVAEDRKSRGNRPESP